MENTAMAKAFDAAITTADHKVELPQETQTSTMRLCGLRIDGMDKAKITVPAMDKRRQGVIIVGPRMDQHKDIHSTYDLIQQTTVTHWSMDPSRRGGIERKTLTKPAISPTHVIRLSCAQCGHTEDIWWDDLFRKHAFQRKTMSITLPAVVQYVEAQKRGKQNHRRGGHTAPPLICPRCADASKQVLMRQQHVPTSLLPAGLHKREVNPICSGMDDPIIAAMVGAWRGELPSSPDATFLPRIWAVYRRGQAPTDLPPHDPKGQRIDKLLMQRASKGKSYTIRPARVAFEVRKPMALNFLMEGSAGIEWGWVTEDDIYGQSDLGYKRKFIAKERTHSGRRQFSV